MSRDFAKTREGQRSEQIRQKFGWMNREEIEAYRAHLARIADQQARAATNGPALRFTDDEDGQA
jgi:hypothetical protein